MPCGFSFFPFEAHRSSSWMEPPAVSRGKLVTIFSSILVLSLLLVFAHLPSASRPSDRSSGGTSLLNNDQGRRRKLPGSFPPSCVSKCGACAPCRAVHVPVSPGRPVVAEYYPEAWRCKCGSRLYMP